MKRLFCGFYFGLSAFIASLLAFIFNASLGHTSAKWDGFWSSATLAVMATVTLLAFLLGACLQKKLKARLASHKKFAWIRLGLLGGISTLLLLDLLIILCAQMLAIIQDPSAPEPISGMLIMLISAPVFSLLLGGWVALPIGVLSMYAYQRFFKL